MEFSFLNGILRKEENNMSIIRYNSFTSSNLPNISLSEMSYIINSYIEESVSNLQVKCLLADNRSIQEYGVRYFTEENEAGQKKLGEKIKGIFEAVWKGIVGIFTKIKTFFSDLITNFRVKAADPKNKDAVKNATDDDINKIVKDKVSVYYDLYKYEIGRNKLSERPSNDGYDYYSFDTDFAKLEGDNIHITKDDLLNSAFGGFRTQYKSIQNKFKDVEKKFKDIKDKTESATLNVVSKDGSVTALEFKNVKEALNAITAYSAGFSKIIIHNAKMLVKVIDELIKKSKKTHATNESVSWDFVF